MNRVVENQVKSYSVRKKKKKLWKKVVGGLAAVTVFCTTYALILPAVTMEQETYCGYEEHTEHTDECYEEIKTLVCELSEEGHVHTEECYAEQQILTCELAETDGHTHGEDCYAEQTTLICELEESEGHIHTDECFNENGNLICDMEEGFGAHHHDEGCYTTESVLMCGREECEPHHHDDTCYITESVLVCGQDEAEPHIHTDECYSVEKVLTCETPIHEHTLQCYSNPDADVENAAVWERTFESVELTGNWNEDVLAIAESQIGYTESSANFQVQDDGETKTGYTRYGDWYGIPYGDWCAMFCSFCLNYAEVDREIFPVDAGCEHWTVTLDELGLYHKAEGCDYTPKPGDLIFFDWLDNGQDGKAEHVGFVYEFDKESGKIKTIDGNSGNQVRYNVYDIDEACILGYGELPENPASSGQTDALMFPMLMSSAPSSYTPENKTSVTVTKKWRGGTPYRSQNVTVHLYQGNESYEDAELSNDNSWSYTFDNLPYMDDSGNPYEYSVVEELVSGFNVSYSEKETIQDTTKGTHYVKESGLPAAGEAYALFWNGYAITANDNSYSGAAAVLSDSAVAYDGENYAGEITGDGIAGSISWTVQYNSDGTCSLKCGDYTLYHNQKGEVYFAETIKQATDSDAFTMDESGYISYVSNSKTYYLKAKAGKDKFEKIEKTERQSEASAFSFFKKIDVTGNYDSYKYTVTNTYSGSGQNVPEVEVKGNKSITYLGNGETNPDTTLTGSNFYRQYLDVCTESDIGVDFLFVVDNTSSMHDEKDKNSRVTLNNASMYRDEAVNIILNGAVTDATEDGLLTQVLRANSKNKAAVITFCGIGSAGMSYNKMFTDMPEIQTVMSWQGLSTDDIASFTDVRWTEGGGTCYESAVLRADEIINDPSIANDGNIKVVIFLGDGEPNGFLYATDQNTPATVDELDDKDSIYFNWSASDSDASAATKIGTDYFVLENPGIPIYTISVGASTGGLYGALEYMAEETGGAAYAANSGDEIMSAFLNIVSAYYPSHLAVTDTLSQYAEVCSLSQGVELYTDQLDFIIKRIGGETETVIWSGELYGNSIGSAVNGGGSYIQSVTYDNTKTEDSTGKITVNFQPTYVLETGVKYVISYNLKTTETAEEEYAANGYNATGDPGTDTSTLYTGYGLGKTSAEKEGFYSNKSAEITYVENGSNKSVVYKHPVVQVEVTTTTLKIKKTVSGEATDESFPFKVTLSGGSFTAPTEEDSYTIDEDGAAIFYLRNNGEITLKVPVNVTATITEVSHNGYLPLIRKGSILLASGDTASVQIGTEAVALDVVNTPGYELPNTGGIGTFPLILGGITLLGTALITGFGTRRRRERRYKH